MLFNSTPPPPQDKYIAPKYLRNSFLLNAMGYKNTGERNVWGEITSWLHPETAFTGDLIMKQAAKNFGASDTADNLNATQDRDLQKLFTVGNVVGHAAVGDYAGAVSGAAKGVGQVYGTPNADLSDDSEMIPQYKMGAKISPFTRKLIGGEHEDIDMVDRTTGKKVGEVSYGETVFSKSDTARLEKWFSKGDKKKLGEATFEAMENHKSKAEEQDQWSEGGKLTAAKARLILKDGTIRGKKITEKQRKYFGAVASGSNKYWDGGPITTANYLDDETVTPTAEEMFGQSFSLGTPQGVSNKMEYGSGSDTFAPSSTFDEGGKNFLDKVGGIDQIWNATKAITGLLGTREKVPKYQRTPNWEHYLNTWKQMSEEGYTPQEISAATDAIQSGYASDLNNIREISGGNSAFALGQSGGAVNRFVKNMLQFNASDSALRRSNFNQYGDWVAKDEAINQDQFNRDYNLAIQNKTAASELAQSGIQGMFDAADYNKYYGKDSDYWKYLTSTRQDTEAMDKLLDDPVFLDWVYKTKGKGKAKDFLGYSTETK